MTDETLPTDAELVTELNDLLRPDHAAVQAAEQVHGLTADLVEGVERRSMQAAERLRRGGG